RGVGSVDHAGLRGIEGEAAGRERRRHEQDQDRPHPVEAEALPELGEEERREAARMAEEAGIQAPLRVAEIASRRLGRYLAIPSCPEIEVSGWPGGGRTPAAGG